MCKCNSHNVSVILQAAGKQLIPKTPLQPGKQFRNWISSTKLIPENLKSESADSKKNGVYTNFLEECARTSACFLVTRLRHSTELVQKNLFGWTFSLWVDFGGWIFLLFYEFKVYAKDRTAFL